MVRLCMFLSLLVSLVIAGWSADGYGGDDFAGKYRAYQAALAAGKAAFDRKEHASVIEHYSKAIGLSPFEATKYNS